MCIARFLKGVIFSALLSFVIPLHAKEEKGHEDPFEEAVLEATSPYATSNIDALCPPSSNGRLRAFIEGSLGYGKGWINPGIRFEKDPKSVVIAQNAALFSGESVNFLNYVSRRKSAWGGFSGGIHLGIDYRFRDSCATLGGMFGGNLLKVTGTSVFPVITAPFATPGTPISNLSAFYLPITFYDRGYYDVAVRLGGMFFQSNLHLFFKAGLAWHRVSAEAELAPNEMLIFRAKYTRATLLGLGVDVQMSPRCFVGGTLNLHVGNMHRLNPVNAASLPGTAILRNRAMLLEALVTIKYALSF